MRRLTFPFLLLAVASLLAAEAFAQTAYELQVRIQAGTESRYVLHAQAVMSLPGPDGAVQEVPLKQRAVFLVRFGEADPDGNIPVTIIYEQMTLTVGGEIVPLPDFGAIDALVTRAGRLVEAHVPDALNQAGVDFHAVWKNLSAPLPDHPVRIGESWEVEETVPVPLPGGALAGMQIKTHYTLEAVEVVDGEELARLSLRFAADAVMSHEAGEGVVAETDLKQTGAGLVWLRVANGDTVRGELETNMEVNVLVHLKGNRGTVLQRVPLAMDLRLVVEALRN